MVTTTPKRQDGRAGNELRPFASEQGALFRADGSARMSHGSSTVLAAVYGPGQARNWRAEKTDKATLDVCFKLEKGIMSTLHWVSIDTLRGLGGGANGLVVLLTASKEKEYEQIIRETFTPVVLTDSFPRAVISIVVQVIEDNGSISFPLPAVRRAVLRVFGGMPEVRDELEASESVAAFFRIVQQKKHPLEPATQ
ncbi:hypothetical protein ON010_g11369 [Phytophthora cinnamomi]|nr:hypothetical protein ON010_g11369 [Phytophthora cinnamomi]